MKQLKNNSFLNYLLAIMLLLPVMLNAQTLLPKLINYQGKLTNSSGQVLSGSYAITFSLFDALYGGTEVWNEQQNVSVENGLYNVVLGTATVASQTQLAALPFDVPYWIQIKVGSETLNPRQLLTASPYAFRSVYADSISTNSCNSGQSASSSTYWRGDGTWSPVSSTGGGDMTKAADGVNIAASTTTLGTRITATAVSTGTIRADLTALTISTGTLMPWNNQVSLSTAVVGNLGVAHLATGSGANATTFWRGDGTWATPTGAGDMTKAVDGSNIATSTTTLGTRITATAVSTGTIRTDLTTVAISTGTLMPWNNQVSLSTAVVGNLGVAHLAAGSGANATTFWRGDGSWATPTGAGDMTKAVDGANIATSTTTMGARITATAVSTGTLKMEIDAVALSTGTFQPQINALGVSTGTIKAGADATAVSTGTLKTEIDAVALSTGTFKSQIDALGASTGTIKSELDAVAVSTGAIRSDLTALAISTGTANLEAGTLKDTVRVSTMSLVASGTAGSGAFLRGDGSWHNSISGDFKVTDNGLFYIGTSSFAVSGSSLTIAGTEYVEFLSTVTVVKLYQSGADLAEVYSSSEKLDPGDVVVISSEKNITVERSKAAYDTRAMGVVSTDPGNILGSIGTGYPIALAGRVPVKVTAENGPIKRGDILTTSSKPGYAMKATEPKIGTIIGKALEPLDSGTGKITVFITLQ